MAEPDYLPPQDHPRMTDDKTATHIIHKVPSPPPTPPPLPHPHRRLFNRRVILASITILLLLAAVTALILWIIYKPKKPSFIIVGAAIYALNITTPPFLASSMQFTLITTNPNMRVALYYDRLSVTVYYRDEAITQPVQLPALYQEKHSTVVMTTVVGGGVVPISAEVAGGLAADGEVYGVVGLRMVVMGRVRYEAGVIRTGRYGLYVRCDLLVGFKRGFVGQVPILGNPRCKVDI